MKRIHLFEFIDQPWYPGLFRRMQADYLQFAATMGAGHQNLVPLFKKAFEASGTNHIIDLCSGGSGPWVNLRGQLAQAGHPVSIKLTDKYPHPESIAQWPANPDSPIEYLSESVDAMQVPPHLTGMRTMFEGFHHFRPEEARAILQDAASRRAPIGIFEASLMPPLGWLVLLLSPLITLLAYIFVTPFIKPRKFSRFLFTYLIPLVPLATCWDGVISLLRVYSPPELAELTAQVSADNYTWESGTVSTGTPIFAFTYLIGYPV
jgi:hypothetical protein